ncbi:D-amino-acid dehydrogenase [Verrucomicrobiota bacterium]|nr:D-amino-acid dehydrogenase [Verrucomicrobiota bacterium]
MSGPTVIVGGGIVGVSAAYELLRRGRQVVLLEKGAADHDSCSLGNAGMIVPSHFVPLAAPGMVALGLKWMFDGESPFWVRPRLDPALFSWGWKFWRASTRAHVARCEPILRDLNLRSRALFLRHRDELPGRFDLEDVGLLALCQTQQTLDHEAVMAARSNALGVPTEVLSADEVRWRDPGVDYAIAGAVLFTKDAHLDPRKLVASLTAEVTRLGGRIVFDAEVTGWKGEGDLLRAAVTKQGEFAGETFVLAAGAWSPAAAGALGLRIPMQAGKGYSMRLERPVQRPKYCSLLMEARVAVTPMGSALTVGGTMEITGNDLSVNPARVRGIRKAFVRYYPAFKEADFEALPVWSGLRPCPPDGMPYLGRTRAKRNLIVATGHSMMGLSLGPVTGEIVAQLICGEPTSVDLKEVDPDRHA